MPASSYPTAAGSTRAGHLRRTLSGAIQPAWSARCPAAVLRLDQNQPVARVVAHDSLDAVRAVSRLLQEGHALATELGEGLVAVVDVQTDAPHLALVQLTAHEVCSIGVQRRAGRHQRQLEFWLAGVADGDPPIAVIHRDVGPRLETKYVDVEVPCLILIETVDGDKRNIGDHEQDHIDGSAAGASLRLRCRSDQRIKLGAHPQVDDPAHEEIATGNMRPTRTGPPVPIRSRCFADQLLEAGRERTKTRESHRGADLADR